MSTNEIITWVGIALGLYSAFFCRASYLAQLRSAPARLAVSLHLALPDYKDALVLCDRVGEDLKSRIGSMDSHLCIVINNVGASEQAISDLGFIGLCDSHLSWDEPEDAQGRVIHFPFKILPGETVRAYQRLFWNHEELTIGTGFARTVCGEVFRGSSQSMKDLLNQENVFTNEA